MSTVKIVLSWNDLRVCVNRKSLSLLSFLKEKMLNSFWNNRQSEKYFGKVYFFARVFVLTWEHCSIINRGRNLLKCFIVPVSPSDRSERVFWWRILQVYDISLESKVYINRPEHQIFIAQLCCHNVSFIAHLLAENMAQNNTRFQFISPRYQGVSSLESSKRRENLVNPNSGLLCRSYASPFA